MNRLGYEPPWARLAPRRCWCPSTWYRWCCIWPHRMLRRSPASSSMSCSGTSNTAWAGGSAGKCRSSAASPCARAITAQGAIRHPLLALEHGGHLLQDLLKRHDVLSVSRLGVAGATLGLLSEGLLHRLGIVG